MESVHGPLSALSQDSSAVSAVSSGGYLKEEDLFQDGDEGDDEIYQIIDTVVSRFDDSSLPMLTLRVWIIGLSLGILVCLANTILSFRTNSFVIPPFFAVLVAYPCGLFLARVIPPGFGNPGPFNFKEHTLIYVIANTMSAPPYALYNVIGQRYQLYQSDLSLLACIVFVIVTQCFGYGFAGLTRRFLVHPAAMLWPSNFAIIALLKSIHANEDSDDAKFFVSRFRFFWLATFAIFVFQFLPSYLAPMLGALSVICWFVRDKSLSKAAIMLGSSSPSAGVGFLSFTLDWSIISVYAPITSPLWATVNQFVGLYIFMWIIIPIVWLNNGFGNDQALGSSSAYGFEMNTPSTYNRDGISISNTEFLSTEIINNRTLLLLNTTFYEANAPIYITTYFAIEYFSSFMVFTAAFSHVGLWYGRDIWKRLVSNIKHLDEDDIHVKLMRKYDEVPDWWYWILLTATAVAGILVCQFGGFDLAWWAILLGIVFALASIVPIGIIQAISGQQIGINVMSEFLIGLILPGRIASVMTFKTFSYMAMFQGLAMVQDLKLGHYIKIAPKSMFLVQLSCTVLGAVISVLSATAIYESFGKIAVPVSPEFPAGFQWAMQVQGSLPNSGWAETEYEVFLSAGAIWGAIGPARFFGPGSPYFVTLIGFVLGLVLPVVPWALSRLQPDSFWHLINVPLLAVFPAEIGGRRSDLITPLLVALFVNYYLKKYRYTFWKRYAYTLSSALDAGSGVTLLLVFFFSQFNPNYLLPLPSWLLNPPDQERCLPDQVLFCMDRAISGNAYGRSYNVSQDSQCADVVTP